MSTCSYVLGALNATLQKTVVKIVTHWCEDDDAVDAGSRFKDVINVDVTAVCNASVLEKGSCINPQDPSHFCDQNILVENCGGASRWLLDCVTEYFNRVVEEPYKICTAIPNPEGKEGAYVMLAVGGILLLIGIASGVYVVKKYGIPNFFQQVPEKEPIYKKDEIVYEGGTPTGAFFPGEQDNGKEKKTGKNMSP